MPNYRWTCAACGETNASAVDACIACSCPAFATVKQIRVAREHVVSEGGGLREAALVRNEYELSAFDVLVRPAFVLLFGWFPQWQRSK